MIIEHRIGKYPERTKHGSGYVSDDDDQDHSIGVESIPKKRNNSSKDNELGFVEDIWL